MTKDQSHDLVDFQVVLVLSQVVNASPSDSEVYFLPFYVNSANILHWTFCNLQKQLILTNW